MVLVSASSFYRLPSDQRAYREDSSFINASAGLYGVADGVSEPYSPSNPAIRYAGGISGGKMASSCFAQRGTSTRAIDKDPEDFLLEVNRVIARIHKVHGKDPMNEPVGSSCFSLCKLEEDGVSLRIGGDCFVFAKTRDGFSFYSGVDQFAYDLEEHDNAKYAKYLALADGDKGKAWDLYFDTFYAKQMHWQNRNFGNGGLALLNGNPAVAQGWTAEHISWDSRPEFILLGTDGLLPTARTNPSERYELVQELGEIYSRGGLQAVLDWRDNAETSLAHITGHPEATAVELKFG